jgi:O-acetyl-ADP-ribose deacetylase (regulator of RNase III)
MVIILGDITQMDSEAIVNAANSGLMGGGGVDGAIHQAGGPEILEECRRIIDEIGECRTGQAVITSGGRLPARYVIHTVGPVWRDGQHGEPVLLAAAYRNALTLAEEHGLSSVSFPSISTGAYRFPLERAAATAVGAVTDFLMEFQGSMEVRIVLYDRETYEVYLRAADKALKKGNRMAGGESAEQRQAN